MASINKFILFKRFRKVGPGKKEEFFAEKIKNNELLVRSLPPPHSLNRQDQKKSRQALGKRKRHLPRRVGYFLMKGSLSLKKSGAAPLRNKTPDSKA